METLARSAFQAQLDGAATDLYTLQGAGGLQVSVCNHGARLVQLGVPDHQGGRVDVTLGYSSLQGYLDGQPSMGAFIGRWAGRLRQGQLRLPNGRSLQLPLNGGLHAVHGGPKGCRFRTFQVDEVATDALHLSHMFRTEDDGVPGQLRLQLRFHVMPTNELSVAWKAEAAGEPTLAQFTFHPFFNLNGSCSALDHLLHLPASRFLPLERDVCPSGHIDSVDGTPLDFRVPRTPRTALAQPHPQLQMAKGLDHYLLLDSPASAARKLALAARLTGPSGLRMEVHTSEPGLQFYAGHGLTGELPRDLGRGGWQWAPGDGLCLEPMTWPDAPNQAASPNPWLAPGDTRRGEIRYRFT